MDWSEFAERLATTLQAFAQPGRDRALTIHSSVEPTIYVQFAEAGGLLLPEVSSAKKYLPKHLRLTVEDENALVEAGWEPQRKGNWTYDFAAGAGADRAEFDALANACITGLRDVFSVESPSLLRYQSFYFEDNTSITMDNLGIPPSEDHP